MDCIALPWSPCVEMMTLVSPVVVDTSLSPVTVRRPINPGSDLQQGDHPCVYRTVIYVLFCRQWNESFFFCQQFRRIRPKAPTYSEHHAKSAILELILETGKLWNSFSLFCVRPLVFSEMFSCATLCLTFSHDGVNS